MKNLFSLALVLFVALAFVGCDSDGDDNGAPTATADTATALEATAETIDVLANDTDPDGDDLMITAVGTASNGSVEIVDGEVVYTSDLGFSGQDSFTYTVSDGSNTATGTVTVDVVLQLVGTWLSEGANVAPGLVQLFGTTRVDATFEANGTYEVLELRGAEDEEDYSGTYEVEVSDFEDENGNPIYTITLNQALPTPLTSQGIYAFGNDGESLRYEVIQTQPEIQGFTPATAEAGFGSTAFNGTPLAATWIQQYVHVGE